MATIRQRRTPPADFGPALRQARERAGLGPAETARQASLTPSYLAKLERGTRCPSVTVAGRLADVLDVEDEQRQALLAGAVNDAGADHPGRRRA